MKKAKNDPTKKSAEAEAMKPLDKREYPLARSERASASRNEIRQIRPRINAPRSSRRAVERSGQKRTH